MLACDLVASNQWRALTATDPRVVELSALLQQLPVHPLSARGEKFRNPNGVGRKTADIATQHPGYEGKPTNGNKLNREVLYAFLRDPDQMHANALALRVGIIVGEFTTASANTSKVEGDPEAFEGGLLERRYFARERNPALRKRKIDAVLAEQQRLACEVCEFDFAHTYGERGAGYAEVHHVTPLHVSGSTTTRLRDLVILCANCHRMIHRGRRWLTPNELRELIDACAVSVDDAPACATSTT
ncbi:HNH endonuclease [Kutzneria albida]|uniref:HNH nuclease domain-containing protein n=1 Tax=Kutzneria albida DSM 43870 TaxID=1449976 RepID=W5WK81_9PSEU|nr:HNH endonuclease [Kutzneria albida]AHH98589.1 hypothetical protein KALB_5227 [Kutzneria albida DSM 43870]